MRAVTRLAKQNERRKKRLGCPSSKRRKIRLITHSHGGNVALNIAKIIPHMDTHFAIDQLILLACPVQDHTKDLIHHPIFKQCYSLYSRLDLMQIIDPQGIYGPSGFFRSHFLSERCFPLNDRLHQIKIRMNRRAITHSEFTMPPFLEQLAVILNEIDVWRQQKSFYGNKKMGAKHLLSLETHLLSPTKKRSRRNA